MSLARKMKRRDVIPEAKIKHIMAQGQLRGVRLMEKGTTDRLSEAYDIGFNEAETKATISVTVLAVAVLHDKFGFGKDRAKRFAEALSSLMDDVNAERVKISEIMQTLVEENIDVCNGVTIEDGQGNIITLAIDDKETIDKALRRRKYHA